MSCEDYAAHATCLPDSRNFFSWLKNVAEAQRFGQFGALVVKLGALALPDCFALLKQGALAGFS